MAASERMPCPITTALVRIAPPCDAMERQTGAVANGWRGDARGLPATVLGIIGALPDVMAHGFH